MSNFKNHDNPAVGFESSWKETRSFETCDTQTEPIKSENEGTQNIVTSCKQIQTSNDCPNQVVSLSKDEEKSLADFLAKISCNVLKELDKNDASNAMARLVALDYDDVEDVSSERMQSFEAPTMEITKVRVSCISWNCMGSLLAVGFCSQDHDTWCSHSGLINFYNTEKSAPTRTIKTKSCVTSISMHPYELSLLAAGMYSGEVCTYNLNLEDVDCAVNSNIAESSRVTQVSWEYTEGSSTRPLLAVSSLDGTLALLHVSLQTGSMTMAKNLIISDPITSSRPGVLCFAFSPRQPHSFISGVEGGSLYSGSSREPPHAPILSSFSPHATNVTHLSFCTHSSANEAWFLSGSLDEVRLYDLETPAPLHVISCQNYCLGLAWSVTQPQVIFYWGNGRAVTVYNITRRAEITTLDMNNQERTITVLDINTKVPSLVATGNEIGEAQVWQIPKYFKL